MLVRSSSSPELTTFNDAQSRVHKPPIVSFIETRDDSSLGSLNFDPNRFVQQLVQERGRDASQLSTIAFPARDYTHSSGVSQPAVSFGIKPELDISGIVSDVSQHLQSVELGLEEKDSKITTILDNFQKDIQLIRYPMLEVTPPPTVPFNLTPSLRHDDVGAMGQIFCDKNETVLEVLRRKYVPEGENSSFIINTISNYGSRKGFKAKLKGLVYRVIQCVKAIFGRSNWNKAVKLTLIMNAQQEIFDELESDRNESYTAYQSLINKNDESFIEFKQDLPTEEVKAFPKNRKVQLSKVKRLKSVQKKLANVMKKHADSVLRSYVNCTRIKDESSNIELKVDTIVSGADEVFTSTSKYTKTIENLTQEIKDCNF